MRSRRHIPSPGRGTRLRAYSSKVATPVGLTLLAIMLTAVVFLVGAKAHPKLVTAATGLGLPEQGRAQAFVAGTRNYLASYLTTETPESLLIDIKFKHMEQIRTTRDEALALNVLNTTSQDFVPATIRHLDRSIRVKLRLKGDHTDHLQGNKWSFLVEVKGDDQLFGMRRFSLMNPRVRADQLEPMGYAYLQKLGFLAPKYFFVNLTINGNRVGVMALEEFPTKELLESQGRRESVIIRFDESQIWADFEFKGFWDDTFDNYATAPIKVSQEGKIRRSAKLTKDLEIAAGLLKGHVRGLLPASEVFNVEEYARFLAALEVLSASNGIWWGNLRFYYNPITARLEPVASDLMSDSAWTGYNSAFKLNAINHAATRAILADPEAREVFVSELHRLVAEVEDGTIEAFLKPLDEKFRKALSRDLPFLVPFDFAEFKRRAEYLSTVTVENLDYFNDMGKNGHARLLHAHEIQNDHQGTLELTNVVAAPVEIVSINWRPHSGGSLISLDPVSPVEYPLQLSATDIDTVPEVVTIPFVYPKDPMQLVNPADPTDMSRIEVVARIKGTDRTYVTTASRNFSSLARTPIPFDAVTVALKRHSFLHQVGDSTLSVQPGQHIVAETLSTPPGYELLIPADTTLLFAPGASLIVNGALNITGTADNPVVLDERPEPGDSNGTGWPGIAVLGAKQPSLWKHVHVRNTTGVAHGDWELTGGVTFYESRIQLENVSFTSNRAEDALNIVRSNFDLANVVIKDTVSDGFDSDFSHGSITDGVFENIGTAGGGDAVDISGSIVAVTGTQFRIVSDKALSVGEGSQMTASGVQIDGALTGAASKDASVLEISSSTINDVQIAGLMAYVKKPEYGTATIEAKNMQFSDTSSIALAQTGSKIRIDGKVTQTDKLDVDKLYESHMKKASP